MGSFSTVVKQFVIDYTVETMDPLMEHEVNGLDYRYVYGNERLSVNISPIPNGAGHVVETGTVGQQIRLYYHQDLRGTVDYLTSPVSQKVESWTHYNEWGEITHNAVLKMGQRELDLVKNYTGHDFDAVLNMYYAKARMYDAENRRFVSVDPILDGTKYDLKDYTSETINFSAYVYVRDNPLRWIDPLGLYWADDNSGGSREEKTGFYIVTENNVNIRLTPGTNNQKNIVLGQANQGDLLFTDSIESTLKDGHTWYKILYGNDSAWIASEYVSFVETEKPSFASGSYSQSNGTSQAETKVEKIISETGYLEITSGGEVNRYLIYVPTATGKHGDNTRNYPEGGTVLSNYHFSTSFSITDWAQFIAGVDLGAAYDVSDRIYTDKADEKSNYGLVNDPSMTNVTMLGALSGIIGGIHNSTRVFQLDLEFSEKGEDIYVAIELSTNLGGHANNVFFDEDGWYFYRFSYDTLLFHKAEFNVDMGAKFFEKLNVKHHFAWGHPMGMITFYLFMDRNGEWFARPKKFANDYIEVVKMDYWFEMVEIGEFHSDKYDLNSIFTNTVKVDEPIKAKVAQALKSAWNAVILNDG